MACFGATLKVHSGRVKLRSNCPKNFAPKGRLFFPATWIMSGRGMILLAESKASQG